MSEKRTVRSKPRKETVTWTPDELRQLKNRLMKELGITEEQAEEALKNARRL